MMIIFSEIITITFFWLCGFFSFGNFVEGLPLLRSFAGLVGGGLLLWISILGILISAYRLSYVGRGSVPEREEKRSE